MVCLLKPRSVVACACALACCAAVARAQEQQGGLAGRAVRYARDIRPILSDNCFKCHGPDTGTRAAGLRLDLREEATAQRDGGAAIVPGDPDASLLWGRITSEHPATRMPPLDSNKPPLSEAQRNLIRQWIAEGAAYEPHWAFAAPSRPPVPDVREGEWARGPIDRFVLARLESDNLKASPDAGRDALIRRLFLDLTGLPPTPEESEAFLKDERPDAYEHWIDKLFSEEPYRTRYAERMTVPWLDAARYADTCGIHMDAGRQMWLWRDWVLSAFRENMPFERFVTEQLAGDLLPNATEQQKIASGFNRNHVTTDEGGAIDAEYLVEYAADRANTTGSVLLGLTLGCARCHDHKFDPVTQEEYYRFYAFFSSNEEPGLYSQVPDPNRALEPFIVVPTAAQKAEMARLTDKLAKLTAESGAPRFNEDVQRADFVVDKRRAAGLAWEPTRTVAARSVQGATLAVQPDGSVLASGGNPERDEHILTLRTDAPEARVLLLEALPDPSLPSGRIGRAPNGNAVLTGVEAEARSIANPHMVTTVRIAWAWADIEQENGDFRAINLADTWDDRGWAVDGEKREGRRVALLVADRPFGFAGGTELRVRLQYHSVYAQHVLGRVRLTLGRFSDTGLDLLPTAMSGWYQLGPFPAESREAAYKLSIGAEKEPRLDLAKTHRKKKWQYAEKLRDEQVNAFPDGPNVTYVARRILSPTARRMDVSLGSDDGFALFVNGRQVAAREIDRGVAPDQEKVAIDLEPGENTLLLKIVNTGGPGAFYYRSLPREQELFGDLVAIFVPESARSPEVENRALAAWKERYSPGYREQREAIATVQRQIPELEAKMPRTMVMKELPKPRETFVLVRGQYDKPDKKRPVTGGVPVALGAFPKEAPQNRLGLAQWLTSAENPLVARVAVNRMWEMLFGTGLVATSEDFGLQGEWPSHPELLDWLAVEFRESGWNVQHMLRLMLTSSTYRQASRVHPEMLEHDPDNRLLTWFPRRRLGAEFIRDHALYVSGLLVEQLGGPSVKPYQPPGLWEEVAMIQSNTRIFKRGEGNDLWRRSLYTYWKRACPPPSLMTFDAPTRESCTIKRPITNTPLQALVLWNDEQFVEAARVLAARTVRASDCDLERMRTLFVRCVGRQPEQAELKRAIGTLKEFRDRYRGKPDDAKALISVGVSPVPADLDATEVAAWTMIANALLNLSATISQT